MPNKDVLPDSKFNSKIVTKLINQIMMEGKKGIAQNIVYNAFDIIKEKTSQDASTVFMQALENTMPMLETKARRVGGATYQVPMEVRPERRQTLGIRWIVQYSRKRTERGMENKIAGEIIDAYSNAGGAVKRKEEMHRMAEANRAFAHYKW
ncbi:MAG: 30S ribosomal protein S7 [Clostridia bacterium]